MTESEFMLTRFRDICPCKSLIEIDVLEVESDCKTAFEIIGFHPSDFDVAFNKAWETSDATDLADFIYDVWRYTDE